jgi:hypothetical protein
MDTELQRIVDLQDMPKKQNQSSTWPLLGMLGGLVLTGIMIFGGKEEETQELSFKWPWDSDGKTEDSKPVYESQELLNLPEPSTESTPPSAVAHGFTKPEVCFDPISLDDTVKINEQVTTFYVLESDGKLKKAYCFANNDLRKVLNDNGFLFQRCPSNTRPDLDAYSSEDGAFLRKIPLQYNVFVKEDDAKKLIPGNQYIVSPTETPVGNIISLENLTMCFTSNDKLYKIKQA